MTAIERSADTLQVHLAGERAQGFVETLEVLKVLKPAEIESVYLIMDDASRRRCCDQGWNSRKRDAATGAIA